MARDAENKSQVTQRIEDSALTRYKRRLDARYPIKERDLEHPSRAALVGSTWMKFLLMLVITVFLAMHSMGLDGSTPLAGSLTPRMILTDLCIGWAAYGLVSLFTYIYPRTKNPVAGIVLFAVMCAIIVASFFVWDAMAQAGGLVAFPIVIIVLGVIPFIMDIWGFINYTHSH